MLTHTCPKKFVTKIIVAIYNHQVDSSTWVLTDTMHCETRFNLTQWTLQFTLVVLEHIFIQFHLLVQNSAMYHTANGFTAITEVWIFFFSFLFVSYPPLGGGWYSVYVNPHKWGRLKWPSAITTLCVAWCQIRWFASLAKFGHTWHQMSFLRPGIFKQYKPFSTK